MALENVAAWIPAAKADLEVKPADMPIPGPDEIVVKNESIALNPIEAKIQKLGMLPLQYPNVIGMSFSGIVTQVGSDVIAFKAGDKVASNISPGKSKGRPAYGTYQRYVLVPEVSVAKLHDATSLDDASAIMTGLETAVGALVLTMGLQKPSLTGSATSNGEKVLIYGGSTSVGGLAVQLARDAGYTVITTSSPRNMAAVENLGAAKVIDHTQAPEALLESLKAEGPYDHIFEVVGLPHVTQLMSDLLVSQGGGIFYSTRPPMGPESFPENVKKVAKSYPSLLDQPENEPVKKWLLQEYVPNALSQGLIVPTKVEKIPGGLGALQGALNRLLGGVSGVKLVVAPWE